MGLAIARAYHARQPRARVLVLEKEHRLGAHASGRNSGVLHSGIYYTEGTLKARICAEGARRMAAYCEERGVPLRRMGKVIVPTREADGRQLETLRRRGLANGALFRLIDTEDLRRIEPHVRSATGAALYNADTSVVNPEAVLDRLADDLRDAGVEVRLGTPVTAVDPKARWVQAGPDRVTYGHLFNAAGLHADVIAQECAVGCGYRILPFKGNYYRLRKGSRVDVNGLVYPVPDLRFPFLGVHATRSVNDATYIGPTATPALGRENYRGLHGLDPADVWAIGRHLGVQYMRSRAFRRHVHAEGVRALKPVFVRAARRLLPGLEGSDLERSSKVGIRAQLLDMSRRELVMDFVVERGEASTHVLNAVSPGFTCALSFADHVIDISGVN